MKKLFFVLSMIIAFNSAITFAASTNNVTKIQHVKDGTSLASASYEITPHSEVETGASIIITFTNATVFSQGVIDGTSNNTKEHGYKAGGYQYNENGITWDGKKSFGEVVPYTNSGKLPYYIRRMNDVQIEVFLMNLPDVYVGDSLKNVNGSTRVPYYSIPLVIYADSDKDAEVTAEIDGNGTSISSTGGAGVNSSLAVTTTLASTETTTETVSEATTENVKNDNTAESKLQNKVEVKIGADNIIVNNVKIPIDEPAYIQSLSSSTMIPLRAVSQGVLGNSDCVKWDSETKTAVITYSGNEVRFTAGSDLAYVNGKNIKMANGVKAEITNNRMFVPFRALGEALGAEMSWNSETKTAYFN